jgi:hypothetical protein
MLRSTREETPITALGVDQGSKFEGYAVVCGIENSLAVKLDLPHKEQIVRKIKERRQLRRGRRRRTCRRRLYRAQNRRHPKGWLAPSQGVVVASRLKVLQALCALYPITLAGVEDVRFNHARRRWGAAFSTVEIGKARIRTFFEMRGISAREYRGYETTALRAEYGYGKCRDREADRFEAHCSDALALACAVSAGRRVEPGTFLVVDDTYRPVRRRLHDTQPTKGGVRASYTRGTVSGYRKGLLIGIPTGKTGRLCGTYNGAFRYHDHSGRRYRTKHILWASTHFIIRPGVPAQRRPRPSLAG